MYLRFDDVRRSPFSWHEGLILDASELDPEHLLSLSPVECDGSASFADPGVDLAIAMTYRQELQCDRCLESLTLPVEDRLELLVLQGPSEAVAEELELEEEELGVLKVDVEGFDTDPLVAEQVILNVPMKPLCRPDCPGLCPSCGSPMAEDRCGCAERSSDPRWRALEAVRERLD